MRVVRGGQTIRRYFYVFVILAALLGFGGGATPARAVWHQDRFLIGGFQVGATADPRRLIQLNDAGIDFVINSDYGKSPRLVRMFDSLSISRPTFSMRLLLYDENYRDPPRTFKNANPVANRDAVLRSLRLGQGYNSPSVMGWMIWDEPPLYYGPAQKKELSSGQIFRNLADMTQLLRDSVASSCCYDKLAFTNLLPMHVVQHVLPECGKGGITTYACYLDKFLSAFDDQPLPAPVLCADIYPFEAPNSFVLRQYFEQLALLRDKAAQYSRPNYRIPFWSVIQCAPRRENAKAAYHPTPNFVQVRWQAFASIAYGAKAVLFWTTAPWQMGEDAVGYGPSFMTFSGGRNAALYDSLRALNAQLHAIGPVLMQLDALTAYHATGRGFNLPPGDTLSNPHRTDRLVAKADGGGSSAIVSHFRHRGTGASYVMVVNKDQRGAHAFKVALGSKASALYRIDRVNGTEKKVSLGGSGTTFSTSNLRPGEGELYRVRTP